MKKMNINVVKVLEFYVSYDIECVNEELQIVATFVKDGEEIYKVYKITDGVSYGAEVVGKLLNRDFAAKKAEDLIAAARKSIPNVFH